MPLKAVLLDLDDTLVQIDTDLFTIRYIDLIAAFIAERFPTVSADQVKKIVINASRQVTRDIDPLHFNQDVINAFVATAVSASTTEFDLAMRDFFTGQYRDLAALATPIVGVQPLIVWLLAHQISIVIATNPLFPAAATHERVRWANIDPDHPGLTLITTAENSHFTKPHLAYFMEILAKIGVPPNQALMVGDNFASDIQPALAAGMSAFWTLGAARRDPATRNAAEADRYAVGSLADLLTKLNSGWPPSSAIPANGSPAQVTAQLMATLATVASMDTQWPGELLPETPQYPVTPADMRSPAEIMSYWSQVEAAFNRPALERIVLEENPFLSLPQVATTTQQSTATVVQAFISERVQTLSFLATRSPEDWKRPARDSVFGPTTLLDMANLIAHQDWQLLIRLHELLQEAKEER